MKKSLSLLLALALVFSAFAGMASAAGSDTQQRYEELKAKGIFAGYPDGTAGLDKPMTRAQFARVAALILGLEGIGATDTKVVTEKPFSDVELDAWYVEEVAAAKEAGIMVGNPDGTFNPNGNITVQELAVVTAQSLGLDPVEGAEVEGAADWAAGYIQALLDKGIEFPTNYTQPATRAQLVDVSYQVNDIVNPVEPEKVSVASAKPIGVQKVEVKLDKAVDTSKAKLTLKRGSATVATTVKWSDDKKSAVLELTSTKIADADYTVTLGGLSADEIATATASFKGENERVAKIEFVAPSDEIAQSTKARVKLRAENQYGEQASFPAANYTVSTDAIYQASIKQNSSGELFVELDTTVSGTTPGLTQIPIYVYNNDNHVTASKTFKLGFTPFPSKLEIGEPKYSNGKDNISSVGDKVTFDLTVLDQYGNPITLSQQKKVNNQNEQILTAASFNKSITPFLNYNAGNDQQVAVEFADPDSDDEYEVTIRLVKGVDKANTHTITVYTGSASNTANFNVGSEKVVTKIDIEGMDGILAAGDADAIVNLLAYDANGDQLSASDIVDNYNDDRIKVSASGADAEIVKVGKNKGKIRLYNIQASAKSYVFVTASVLTPNTNSFDSYQILVNEARVPTSVEIKKKPDAKAILGAKSEFELEIRDQYGEKVKKNFNSGKEQYRVVFTLDAGNTGTTVENVTFTNGQYVTQNITGDVNKKFNFVTVSGQTGTATLKVTIQKTKDAQAQNVVWDDYSTTKSVSIQTIPNNSKLTYSLEEVSSLYAAIDSKLLPTRNNQAYSIGNNVDGPAKKLKLVVKDSAGDTVAYPEAFKSVVTSNPNVAEAAIEAAGQANANTGGKNAYIIGNKAGEATVTAVVYQANGDTTTLTAKVTVKADPISVSEFKHESSKVVSTDPQANQYLWDAAYMDLKVIDQYGVEYAGQEIVDFAKMLNLQFSISDVVGATVAINNTTGQITTFNKTASDYQFVVTVTAPNGESVSTVISNK